MSREIDVLSSYGAFVELLGSRMQTLAAGEPLQIIDSFAEKSIRGAKVPARRCSMAKRHAWKWRKSAVFPEHRERNDG